MCEGGREEKEEIESRQEEVKARRVSSNFIGKTYWCNQVSSYIQEEVRIKKVDTIRLCFVLKQLNHRFKLKWSNDRKSE